MQAITFWLQNNTKQQQLACAKHVPKACACSPKHTYSLSPFLPRFLLAPTDCYDCIDRCILVGGKANFCPVCNILFGPNPWEHHKLKYDFMLDSLVRKVGAVGRYGEIQ